MGVPEDVAACVFRLCTEEFGYVTGSEIYITGGQHLL
jgi:NAD(P)-dependent dehydrogenase (short-subunit alcohol dehydrogenase family)